MWSNIAILYAHTNSHMYVCNVWHILGVQIGYWLAAFRTTLIFMWFTEFHIISFANIRKHSHARIHTMLLGGNNFGWFNFVGTSFYAVFFSFDFSILLLDTVSIVTQYLTRYKWRALKCINRVVNRSKKSVCGKKYRM